MSFSRKPSVFWASWVSDERFSSVETHLHVTFRRGLERLEVTRTTLALEAHTKRFSRKLLGKKLGAFQDIFRNCPYTKIFGQVPPAHHT